MLLFRRELFLSHDESDGPATTVIASFYRDSIDSGYQAMITTMAEQGVCLVNWNQFLKKIGQAGHGIIL